MATASMVSVGTHRLFISISGPPRSVRGPIAVVIAGAGDVSSSYVAVERLVAPFCGIALFDRSGLGRSEDGPQRHTATVAATELHTLLNRAGIHPPFILVGHSYGGIIAREYLHLYPSDVAGMVLADAATERTCHYFKIPDPNIEAVLGSLKYSQVTGLRDDSVLSRDEWRMRAADISRGGVATQAEAAASTEVCETLRQKEQYKKCALGAKPLSVIRCNSARDYERIYEAGVAAGNGTEAQQRGFRELLDRWDDIDRLLKEEQLQLSSRSRLRHVPDCGHNLHLVRPDIFAQEIQWVRGVIMIEPQL
ncbi:alpha/beta hydrolase fold protein [Nannizzia gypsea CBS 118893]|uniref:Alpha/beta hydrolase fold protein n=1 Tax=Arthroderma gypseum (strain ATCC MYA-4604 / CBS 118893) TaxID=535722 RepID=E4V3L9_ARTGP|nr:alpha/beta hydrolase fold protein [Nannizzia gypsea CBS 118893]EFR04593.1 alpha/beta hydrolase fold protein [Nannizzia gypsea CBS 118893]